MSYLIHFVSFVVVNTIIAVYFNIFTSDCTNNNFLRNKKLGLFLLVFNVIIFHFI